MTTWRIWYADGKTVGGVTRKDWLKAPSVGVLCVGVRYDSPPGFPRGVLLEADWFWWTDEPQGSEQTDVTGGWLRFPPLGDKATAKMGALVSDEAWEEARLAMVAWIHRK